jgi:hypothetical protein
MSRPVLPTDPAERKGIPITTGVLDYFPAALAEVAKVSKAGNEQHNPGQPLHWARGKSMDQADTLVRHLLERGTVDTDGIRHSAKLAWRALALLQIELEEAGLAPLARGARLPDGLSFADHLNAEIEALKATEYDPQCRLCREVRYHTEHVRD